MNNHSRWLWGRLGQATARGGDSVDSTMIDDGLS
jgi:hypothetical protein